MREAAYPELAMFPDRKAAEAAFYAWKKRLMRSPRFWVLLTGYTVLAGVFVAVVLMSLRRWVWVSPAMLGGIVGGVTAGSGTVVLRWIWRARCRRFLREQLLLRGIPVCLNCGYSLRGNESGVCPECGVVPGAEVDSSGS